MVGCYVSTYAQHQFQAGMCGPFVSHRLAILQVWAWGTEKSPQTTPTPLRVVFV